MKLFFFTSLLLLMAIGLQAQNTAMAEDIPTAPVVELVVYRIKPEGLSQKALIVRRINETVSTLPGFLSRRVYQSEKDPQLLMDFVEWSTASEAHEAAARVTQLEVFGVFSALIEEVRVFEHFTNFEP